MEKVIWFEPINKNHDDGLIRFYFGGMPQIFTSDRDKNMKTENRAHIINGINHLIEWSTIKGKTEFLERLGLFVLSLKNNINSPKFIDRFEAELKASQGKRDADLIKGKLYVDEFKKIDRLILETILEYTEDNTVSNTDRTSPHAKFYELHDVDIFLLAVTVTLSKLCTLGAILLGRQGRISAYIVPTVKEMLKVIADTIIGDYYYKTGQMSKLEYVRENDLNDSIYLYLRNLIKVYIEKNAITTELLEKNGISKGSLINNIIEESIGTVYKIVPIDLSKTSGTPYVTGNEPLENFKFTSRNIINYIKTVVKTNHEFKNKRKKHNNVIKMKRVPEDIGMGASIFIHKQELRVERRDAKELDRRREHLKLLDSYADKYMEKYDLNTSAIVKSPFTDYFIVKLLNQISEDYITLKLMNPILYTKLVCVISHRLKEKYISLSYALIANSTSPKIFADGYLSTFTNEFNKLNLYNTDSERFEKEFERLISRNYSMETEDGKKIFVNIEKALLQFMIDDQSNPFEFIEGYIYDYE